ncbi:MAG: Na+/H+ antiporter NhaC [Lautropia sp.]|nr:Na+/H+ antiporter NhaC [Lautropia sp.]
MDAKPTPATPERIPFKVALIPLVLMITVMAITVIGLEASSHIPLLVGTIIASIVGIRYGYPWKTVEQSVYRGIRMALPAIVIIILIGLTIGSWIGGGIVATMVHYGLEILSPSLFLFTICLICAAITLAVGSSWATMGTIGVAGMGIGMSVGIPAPMVAGAIVSGAYFGDKLSPLSDTTNLAAGISEVDLFDHIRHMFYTTIPALIIALIVYYILGLQFHAEGLSAEQIRAIQQVLNKHFVISPWLLLVPAGVLVLIMFRVPALPALVAGIIMGWCSHVFVQGGEFSTAVITLHDGYQLKSGNEMVDQLFNRGGIQAMMSTVALVIIAMSFGGVMEGTGMLKALVEKILLVARRAATLITATISSAFLINLTAADQYMSILVPARMYTDAFRRLRLKPKNLSRALEDGGTVTSVLVPWNTCGVFAFSMLGVSAMEFAPYAVLNYSVPLIAILLAFLGIGVEPMSAEEIAEAEREEALAAAAAGGNVASPPGSPHAGPPPAAAAPSSAPTPTASGTTATVMHPGSDPVVNAPNKD